MEHREGPLQTERPVHLGLQLRRNPQPTLRNLSHLSHLGVVQVCDRSLAIPTLGNAKGPLPARLRQLSILPGLQFMRPVSCPSLREGHRNLFPPRRRLQHFVDR